MMRAFKIALIVVALLLLTFFVSGALILGHASA